MTDLLIAFVIPVLVVIAAAILQTLVRCAFKVAAIIFIIVITVALNSPNKSPQLNTILLLAMFFLHFFYLYFR